MPYVGPEHRHFEAAWDWGTIEDRDAAVTE